MTCAKADAVGGLRVGVIGAGVMGSNHARVLAGLPGVTLVGIVDPLPEHRAPGRRTGRLPYVRAPGGDVRPRRRRHYHRSADPSASRISLACITRNIHILVEKPVASTVQEGRDIVNAARSAGVTLMVGHVERFNPAVAAIKQAIAGEDILSIGITRVGPFPPRMSNVGVVIDLAVHDIDLIRWFTESDIVEVQPQLSSAVAEREDIALLQFRTASGVLAHINTNWLTPFKARNVTVATRGKYVMGDLLTRQVTECSASSPTAAIRCAHLPVGHDATLRAELIAFLDAVRTGNVPAVSGGRGRCQPRDRDPLPRTARQARGLRPRKGPRRIAG